MNCSPPGFSTEFSRQEYWSGLPFPIPWESSCPSDQTPVSFISCFGRQILYHECRPEKSHKVTEKKKLFFSCDDSFQDLFLWHFPNMQYSITDFGHEAVCYIPMTYPFSHWKLIPLDPLDPFCSPAPPAPFRYPSFYSAPISFLLLTCLFYV